MNGKQAAALLRMERHFLQNIIKDFREEHADFQPAEGMMTVAQQISHIAVTVAWFREAAFGTGFDTDWAKMRVEYMYPRTLAEAVALLDETYNNYATLLETLSEADLTVMLPPNPIVGEVPRFTLIHTQADHTAHHRGELVVYLRLLGITPTMAYT